MYQKRNKQLDALAVYLGGYDKQFYLREIARLTKIPLKTTQSIVANLVEKRILKSNIVGKNKYFKLNLDNIETKFYLLQAEINKTLLFIEKYKPFKLFLKETKTDSMILVFGSFAKFKAEQDSDLDLLVIAKKQKLPLHLLPYKTHIIELKERLFKESLVKQETLIKEIEESHIILNNHTFYINSMWGYYGK